MRPNARRPSEWTDREPGFAAAIVELGRLRRRAAVRPVLTIGVALVVALGIGWRNARKQRGYHSRIVFSVTEGDVDLVTAPRPNAQLRAWVADVAFNNAALMALAKKRGLYRSEWDRGDPIVIGMFREDIGVEVWRNYFLFGRELGDAARSARIAVSFGHIDPEVAYDVVHDLGRLLVDSQQSQRTQLAEEAVVESDRAVEMARAEAVRLHGEVARREAQNALAPTASVQVELKNLRRALIAAEERLAAKEAERSSLSLRLALERHELGMKFKLVDGGRPAARGASRPVRFATASLIVFLGVLPLVMLAVGAFDRRVFRGDDVQRLGLPVIGHVGDFPGADRGSLRERMRDRAHRVE